MLGLNILTKKTVIDNNNGAGPKLACERMSETCSTAIDKLVEFRSAVHKWQCSGQIDKTEYACLRDMLIEYVGVDFAQELDLQLETLSN